MVDSESLILATGGFGQETRIAAFSPFYAHRSRNWTELQLSRKGSGLLPFLRYPRRPEQQVGRATRPCPWEAAPFCSPAELMRAGRRCELRRSFTWPAPTSSGSPISRWAPFGFLPYGKITEALVPG